jgi:hypothetical protein
VVTNSEMTPAKNQLARSVTLAGMFLPALLGCAQSGRVTTVGFPSAPQDRFPARAGTYDLREEVDDSPDFYHGNFEPYREPPVPSEDSFR